MSGGCISIISISSERSLEILVCVFGFSGHRIGFDAAAGCRLPASRT